MSQKLQGMSNTQLDMMLQVAKWGTHAWTSLKSVRAFVVRNWMLLVAVILLLLAVLLQRLGIV